MLLGQGDSYGKGVWLDSQMGLEGADAVAGDRELGTLGVFQVEDYLACEPGVDFLNPVHIDECGAVDAEEAGGVEAVFKFGNGLIDGVAVAVGDGEGELVLGYEVGDGFKVEEEDAFSDA